MNDFLTFIKSELRAVYWEEGWWTGSYKNGGIPGVKGICFIDLLWPGDHVCKDLLLKEIPDKYFLPLPVDAAKPWTPSAEATIELKRLTFYPTETWVQMSLDAEYLVKFDLYKEYRDLVALDYNTINAYYTVFRPGDENGKILRDS